MFSQRTRWMLGVLAAVVLITGSALLRRYVHPPRPTQSGTMATAAAPVGSEPVAAVAEHPEAAATVRAVAVATPTVKKPSLIAAAAPVRAALTLTFNGTLKAADQTAPAIAEDVQFERTGGAVFPPTAVLAYPDSGGVDCRHGTIALWVRRDWDLGDEKQRTLVELMTTTWENRFELAMGPRFMRFLVTNSDGKEHGVGTGIEWRKGEWHHVAVSWGDGLLALYLDGQPQGHETLVGALAVPPDAQLYVGSSRRGRDSSDGAIALRSLIVLPRRASTDEIAALFSQGAESR